MGTTQNNNLTGVVTHLYSIQSKTELWLIYNNCNITLLECRKSIFKYLAAEIPALTVHGNNMKLPEVSWSTIVKSTGLLKTHPYCTWTICVPATSPSPLPIRNMKKWISCTPLLAPFTIFIHYQQSDHIQQCQHLGTFLS